MRITVLNGSPKGSVSVTMQYVKYIQKHLPQHDFTVIDISHNIKGVEREAERFDDIVSQIRASDGVLWAFPVYYLLVPSQYKRFIELIFERGAGEAFAGKHAAVLTTSIHYYDTVARDYMRAVCDDLNMNYVDDFLADMNDLERPEHRKNLVVFAERLIHAIEERRVARRRYEPVVHRPVKYEPGAVDEVTKTNPRRVVVMVDGLDSNSNLAGMVDVFRKSVAAQVDIVDIGATKLKGGCLGCLNCAYDNQCVYKDDMRATYEGRVLTADAVILAGTIHDRHLSSRWKLFFDRSFYRGHIPFFGGKLDGAIISGPLRQNATLNQWLDMFLESYKNTQVGVVTDEYDSSAEITGRLQGFAVELEWVLTNAYEKPQTFYGMSSRLIFRDFVYLSKGVFLADHKHYKSQGFYDFPQKKLKMRANSLMLGSMFRIKPVRTQIQREMKHHMVSGLERVVRES
ncbi:MAG: NAD(P)H-dependent oxidoreductase [Actinobacteria bacterium]|nr:NAD(P)H-dependent oxidoreductase [Actinomycetota bacterium]